MKNILYLLSALLLGGSIFYACTKQEETKVQPKSTTDVVADRSGDGSGRFDPVYMQYFHTRGGDGGSYAFPIPVGPSECTGTITFNGTVLPGYCYALEVYVTDKCVVTEAELNTAFGTGGVQTAGLYRTSTLAGVPAYAAYVNANPGTTLNFPIFTDRNYWFFATMYPSDVTSGCSPNIPPASTVLNVSIDNGAGAISNYSIPDVVATATVFGPKRIFCPHTFGSLCPERPK